MFAMANKGQGPFSFCNATGVLRPKKSIRFNLYTGSAASCPLAMNRRLDNVRNRQARCDAVAVCLRLEQLACVQ